MGEERLLRSKGITAVEAESILDERKILSSQIEKDIIAAAKGTGNPSVMKFFEGKQNGYMFPAQEVIDLIGGAKYVMVILGAHPKDEDGFIHGDPTVMILPCDKEPEAVALDPNATTTGKEPGATTLDPNAITTTFHAITRTGGMVGLEHPPGSVITQITGDEHGPTNLKFTFS